MNLSPEGYAEIGAYEGLCLRPYFDSVGVLSIGLGHTAAAGPPDPNIFPRDADQPIEYLLKVYRDDLKAVVADVNRLVKVNLEQHQFDALASFHYNTGGLARANLLKLLNAGDFEGATAGFMGWVKPPEIIGRRMKEQTLFRNGVYASKGMANLFPVSASGQPIYKQGKLVDLAALLRGQPQVTAEPAHDAAWIQARLNALGTTPPLDVDGMLGVKSVQAIAKFIEEHAP